MTEPESEATDAYFVMPTEQKSGAILLSLFEAKVEFAVVGAVAARLQGMAAPSLNVDIVHNRTQENVARLLSWLAAHDAYDRSAIPNRQLRPTESALLAYEDIRIQIDLGRLCIRSLSYDALMPDTFLVAAERVEHLITLQTSSTEEHSGEPVLIVGKLGE